MLDVKKNAIIMLNQDNYNFRILILKLDCLKMKRKKYPVLEKNNKDKEKSNNN